MHDTKKKGTFANVFQPFGLLPVYLVLVGVPAKAAKQIPRVHRVQTQFKQQQAQCSAVQLKRQKLKPQSDLIRLSFIG